MESDYIIGSLTKFFPTFDGGVLIANKEIENPPLPLSAKQELKALFNVIHLATQYGRFKWIVWLFRLVSTLRAKSPRQANENNLSHVEKQPVYPQSKNVEILSASRICNYIVDHSDFRKIVEKRKQNYLYILNNLCNEENIDLSFNNRDSQFIPYMVVAVLRQPEKHHPLLIANGLPIWRWEHLYPSQYDIAKNHSKSIIQIPCHQQLRMEELSALVGGIKDCIKN